MSTPVITELKQPSVHSHFQNKLYLKTFGCQMNEYDSSRMFDLLKERFGVEKVEEPELADIILVNTCSVREKAQEKLFDCLGRYKLMKIKNPNLVIGVGGCVASQEGKGIIQRAPFVDLVFGPQTIHKLADMIDEVRRSETRKKRVVDVSFPEIEKFDNLPEPRAEGVKAYVSIIEGCSKYCSFCIVPYTRGEEFSRPFDDVLMECSQLAEQGVREITLLGQNVNHYLGPMHDGKIADLALLIHYISAIKGIGRVRFTTSHPVEFSDTLIDAYAKVPELANHLHLPVQSGSDRVLTLMKRGHTALEFKSKIRRLKAVRPDITISTDIIVGFPGETNEDFEKTMNLVAEIGFDNSFSFIYSARPGTPAADFPDDVPMEEKKLRLKILQDRLKANGLQISRRMVGGIQRILVDSVSKKDSHYVSGRTENNRIVNFKGSEDLIGQFVDVEITEVQTNSLRGVLLEKSTQGDTV